jgi:hypothetical protein
MPVPEASALDAELYSRLTLKPKAGRVDTADRRMR